MKSQSSITYSDLIQEQQRLVSFMEQTYPGRVMAGSLSDKVAQHRLECGRTILRMLKKCEPKKPADLFAIFESFNKKANVNDD